MMIYAETCELVVKTYQKMIESKMLAEIAERFWSKLRRTFVAGAVEKKVFHIRRLLLAEICETDTTAEGTRRFLASTIAFELLRRRVALDSVVLRGRGEGIGRFLELTISFELLRRGVAFGCGVLRGSERLLVR